MTEPNITQVSFKGGPVSSVPQPDGVGSGLIPRHAHVCSGQDGVVVRAANRPKLLAHDPALSQVRDNGVQRPASLMGWEGDMICQTLHRQEILVGGSLHVLV